MDEGKLRYAATLLAAMPVQARRAAAAEKRLAKFKDHLPRQLRTAATVAMLPPTVVQMLWGTRRHITKISSEPPRLYRAATGVTHDDMRADLAAVRERLEELAENTGDDQISDEQLEEATFRLLRWTASGRDSEATDMGEVEDAFQELMEARDARKPIRQIRENYLEAWKRLLRSPGRRT